MVTTVTKSDILQKWITVNVSVIHTMFGPINVHADLTVSFNTNMIEKKNKPPYLPALLTLIKIPRMAHLITLNPLQKNFCDPNLSTAQSASLNAKAAHSGVINSIPEKK